MLHIHEHLYILGVSFLKQIRVCGKANYIWEVSGYLPQQLSTSEVNNYGRNLTRN